MLQFFSRITSHLNWLQFPKVNFLEKLLLESKVSEKSTIKTMSNESAL